MWKEINGVSPSQWLARVGDSPQRAYQVLGTFSPQGQVVVAKFSAPHTFFRFHKTELFVDGSSDGRPIFKPNYWADGSVFSRANARTLAGGGMHLTGAEFDAIAKQHYRDIAAICHDWNPLASDQLWRIALRGNETVEGLLGPIKEQPKFSGNPALGLLKGGGLQVYLNPETPFICTPRNWGT